MIPTKDKIYYIACKGPFDYNQYFGKAICTRDIPDQDNWYQFTLLEGSKAEECNFAEEDILVEMK